MSYVDEYGIKRDDRPDASELFVAVLQASLDRVMDAANAAEQSGAAGRFIYTEHRMLRGLPLFTFEGF